MNKKLVVGVFVWTVASSLAQAAVKFSEIYFSPEEPKQGRQFIELRSLGGGVESLNNLSILEIEGDLADNTGKIQTVINLAGLSTGTNGLFMWRDSATVLDNSPAAGVQGPGVTSVLTLDLKPGTDIGSEDGGLSNDSVTFLLVDGFTGAIGSDLDPNNVGAFSTMPWTSVLDAISIKETADTGKLYAGGVGGVDFLSPFGCDIVGWDPVENMWHFFDSGSGEGNGSYVGPFYANDGFGFAGPSDAAFQDLREIHTAPDSRFLWATPGAPNVTGVGGLYRGDTEQDGDVDAADIDFLYDNLGSSHSRFDVARVAGVASMADVMALVQGDDNGERIEDLFFTEFGDADLDVDIDGLDFLAWQRGFGTDGGWAQGDFNGDDIVNGLDLVTWETEYGFVAPTLSAVATVPEPGTFSFLLVAAGQLGCGRRRRHGK